MSTRLRVGRTEVGATSVLALALASWWLATSALPAADPGLAAWAYAAMAATVALLFVASLAAHELAHGLVARREGVEIESVTLWLLGGSGRWRRPAPGARAELRVAIAGPLLSAALGAGLVAAAALAAPGRAGGGILAWAGYANLALAALNLVPSPPLDGARVLHAALRHATGDARSAARVTTTVAGVAAVTMIGGGAVVALSADALAGAGLVLLGWFLLVSARGEARLAAIERALAGFVVADLMSPDPLVSQEAQTLSEFMAQIPPGDRSDAYPVLDGERPVGVLPSPRHVNGHRWSIERVHDRMVPLERVPLLRSDQSAPEAVTAMIRANAGSALVFEGGRLAGILSSRDVTEALKIGETPG